MEDNLALVLIFGLPIVAVIFGTGSKIVKDILRSQERRLELHLQTQRGRDEVMAQEIASLRSELSELRDTSTQFDMSLEHAVQRLEQRVNSAEPRGVTSPTLPRAEEPQQQRLGQF